MSEIYIRNVIEAVLLAAGRPLSVSELAQLFDETSRPDNAALRAAIDALAASFEGRGIELKETASGIRIQVRQDFAPEVSRLWPERPQRYSRALLETLALIAYRQPITRAEIESVRGVAVNPNIMKTLLERNWIRVVGHRDVPGRPELLGTAREFLDYFGLKSLDDLPALAELKAMGELNLQLPLPGTAEGSGDEVALVSDGAESVAAVALDAADLEAITDALEADLPASDEIVAAGDDLAEDEQADDEEIGVRIEAADDELADFDSDTDGDERDAAGHEATGLVAAPPSHDD